MLVHLAVRQQIAYNGTMADRKATPKTQRQRFIETARELGADDGEAAFERALKKIGSAPGAKAKKAARKPKT